MNEVDLDRAIAQAELFLVLARELKAGFENQKAEMLKAEAIATEENLSTEVAKDRIWQAKYANSVDGTRVMGAVKHACVNLSFFLAKLRK